MLPRENITKQLLWRYATKVFIKGKRTSEAELASILEAGRMAPAAYGLQPFKIVHVTDVALREKLRAEAAFGQPQVTDAGDFFVIARRTDIDEAFIDAYVAHVASVRGMAEADLEGFRSMMKGDILARSEEGRAAWAGRQAYISLGMMLETAALLSVDSCPMEGFDPSKVDAVLDLSGKKLVSLAFFAVGYRGEGDMYAALPKVRETKENLILEI